MGAAIGRLVGAIIAEPFKELFSSCEKCDGMFDLLCFFEHYCFGNLGQLIVAMFFIVAMMYFIKVVWEFGVIQCAVKGVCKTTMAVCSFSCGGIMKIIGFLWHKLRNTKRVYRGRRRYLNDLEEGGGGLQPSSTGDGRHSGGRGRCEMSSRVEWARGESSSASTSARDRRRRASRKKHHGSGRHVYSVGPKMVKVRSLISRHSKRGSKRARSGAEYSSGDEY